MSQIVNVNLLAQIGRPNALATPVAPTSIRFSQIVTSTPISFVFPQGAGTNFKFGIPQSMFVDNSFNNFEMVISVQGTSYSFPVPALSSGYYNVDAIDGDTIIATSAGVSSDVVEIVFYNYDKTPIVWYKNQTTSTAVTIADGADATQGSVADVAVTNPASNATVISLLKGVITLLAGGGGSATKVQGIFASGHAVTNPLVIAGNDGGNQTSLLAPGGVLEVQAADGALVTVGTEADTAITNSASSGTLMAFVKGIVSKLSGTLTVQGPIASGVANSGNPVKAAANANSSARPAVTNGQLVELQSNLNGELFTVPTGSASTTKAGFTNNTLFGFNSGGTTAAPWGMSPFIYNGATQDQIVSTTQAASLGTGVGTVSVEEAGRSFSNITTATTTTAKSGKGFLHTIVCNTPIASATATIYDNTASSGTKIATITLPSTITSESPFSLEYDLAFGTGLTIVTTGASDWTVTYR